MRIIASIGLTFLGIVSVTIGVALIYWPAAFIVFGVLVGGYGAFGIDVEHPEPEDTKQPLGRAETWDEALT